MQGWAEDNRSIQRIPYGGILASKSGVELQSAQPISMALKTLLAEKQRKERSIEKKIKRKGSLLDRFFPKVKRARRTESNSTKMTKAITDNKKKSKPSLDKSRRKEVKRRLNEEANKEIVPLAAGTLAMMGSALSNQGKYM